jgi:hypothetical protein
MDYMPAEFPWTAEKSSLLYVFVIFSTKIWGNFQLKEVLIITYTALFVGEEAQTYSMPDCWV